MGTHSDTILIVDDNPANLGVLFDFLEEEGFKVRVSPSGESALNAVSGAAPDLILLDVLMPGMDGFETCRQLKEQEDTRHIPVIFMTALDDPVDEVHGLQLGAVDYITKPVQVETVLARVNTHLALQKLQRRLEQQNADLESFARTVAHDLKNPLNTIIGFSACIVEQYDDIDPAMLKVFLEGIHQAGLKADHIINALLLLASVRKQEVAIEPLEMARIVDEVKDRLAGMVTQYEGALYHPNSWPVAMGYAPWIEEVWVNYITNGLKYGGERPQLELGATELRDGRVRFWVKDTGPGIRDEDKANLFDEFVRLDKVHVQGHGLGLSIVRRIMDKLGGEVGVESTVGQGSLFFFTLDGVDR